MEARHKTSFHLENTVKYVFLFVQLFYIIIYHFLLYKTCHLQIWLEPEYIKRNEFKLGKGRGRCCKASSYFKLLGALKHVIEKKLFPKEGVRVIDKRSKTVFK